MSLTQIHRAVSQAFLVVSRHAGPPSMVLSSVILAMGVSMFPCSAVAEDGKVPIPIVAVAEVNGDHVGFEDIPIFETGIVLTRHFSKREAMLSAGIDLPKCLYESHLHKSRIDDDDQGVIEIGCCELVEKHKKMISTTSIVQETLDFIWNWTPARLP